MKRFLLILISLVMVLMPITLSASAENFVPSIGYKPAPDVDNDRNGCIIITSVEEAKTTVKIPREIADDLIAKYEELSANGFKLSSLDEGLNDLVATQLGSEYDADILVIRDFFNIFSTCDDMNEYLEIEGQTIELQFDIDLNGKTPYVLVYTEEDGWAVIEAKDNGDGTVSMIFEDFGHVAVLVPEDGYDNSQGGETSSDKSDVSVDISSDTSSDASSKDPSDDTPQTGDSSDKTVWFFVMFAALAAIVALAVVNRDSFAIKKK